MNLRALEQVLCKRVKMSLPRTTRKWALTHIDANRAGAQFGRADANVQEHWHDFLCK
jgi:hypothetical protein